MSQPPSQDTANTLRQQAETVRVLAEVGFDHTEALKAVVAGDLASLTGTA